jgi:hypothetical protein
MLSAEIAGGRICRRQNNSSAAAQTDSSAQQRDLLRGSQVSNRIRTSSCDSVFKVLPSSTSVFATESRFRHDGVLTDESQRDLLIVFRDDVACQRASSRV